MSEAPRRINVQDRICESCPMQELEGDELLEKGVKAVLTAEAEDRPIGTARSELGIAINACRRARFSDRCADVESLQFEFAGSACTDLNSPDLSEREDPFYDGLPVDSADVFEAAGDLAQQLGYR